MTTAMAFESETRLPKTDAALDRAHGALRELQRTLAERLLAEQESYLALEREYQAVKTQRDLLLTEKGASGALSAPITHGVSAIDTLWRHEVTQALNLVDQALDLLVPEPQTEEAL
jgi:hypothetical protein